MATEKRLERNPFFMIRLIKRTPPHSLYFATIVTPIVGFSHIQLQNLCDKKILTITSILTSFKLGKARTVLYINTLCFIALKFDAFGLLDLFTLQMHAVKLMGAICIACTSDNLIYMSYGMECKHN